MAAVSPPSLVRFRCQMPVRVITCPQVSSAAWPQHHYGQPDRLRPWRRRDAPAARPSGFSTSEARDFAKQSRKRVRGLEQDRVAGRGGKAVPLAGGASPRARPARLRGDRRRPQRRRRHGHERNASVRFPRWMHRLLAPRCQRRQRQRMFRLSPGERGGIRWRV